MDRYQIPREISYTDGQRRFRTLLDRCDGCGDVFTTKMLKLVADKVGGAALDDNIVFDCASCLSLEPDSVITLAEILNQITAAAPVNS
jgi:hypothetical protein